MLISLVTNSFLPFLVGLILADVLRRYMFDLKVDNGLDALGFSKEDIPALVEGTLPQVSPVLSYKTKM